jgi:hypothetical protein
VFAFELSACMEVYIWGNFFIGHKKLVILWSISEFLKSWFLKSWFLKSRRSSKQVNFYFSL